MRIFSKKSFQFHHPADQEASVNVQALSFTDVPDWVSDSTMYRLALSEGSIDVVETKADEIKAELKAEKKATAKAGE